MIDVEYFDSKEEWLLGQNPHTRFSGRINITSNKSSAEFVLASTDSPWLRFKIYSGQSDLTNCKIEQDKPKIVLLPANSSNIDFTAVKYNNIKLKYDHGDQSSTPEVSNIKLTLKVLPGFLVTPDGMMNAYNAKIWGSFIGDVNISGGSIRIQNEGGTQVFEVTDQGVLSANSANITGTITETYITANNGGEIAGFTIDNNSIRFGTLGQNNSVLMCIGSDNYADIGGSGNINGWTFASGSKFGVKTDGTLYAANAKISGDISITSGSISIGNKFRFYKEGNLYASSISTKGYIGSYDETNWAIISEGKINLLRRDDAGHTGYDITRFLSGILFAPTRAIPMAMVYHTFRFSGNGTATYDFKDEGVRLIDCAVASCSNGSDQIDCKWSGTTVTIQNNNGECYVGVIAIGYATTYDYE